MPAAAVRLLAWVVHGERTHLFLRAAPCAADFSVNSLVNMMFLLILCEIGAFSHVAWVDEYNTIDWRILS